MLSIAYIHETEKENVWNRQAFMMSFPIMLLQVWGKCYTKQPFGATILWEIGVYMKKGELGGREGTLRRIILINVMCMCPHVQKEGGPSGTGKEMWKIGDLTVDGKPASPAITYPKYVASGICQGYCLGEDHRLW